DAGSDYYHGGAVPSFLWPVPGTPSGRAGSQGFGNNEGFGALVDRQGSDVYRVDNGQGSPVRANNRRIDPDSTCAPTSPTCNGLFLDQEPPL
nr:hypothetical protein [Deltaproteobacteria bacterium]